MKFSLSLSLPFPKVDLESIFIFYLMEGMGNGMGVAERAHELLIIVVHILYISEGCCTM